MSKENVKETKINVPVPRVIKLASGEQVIAGVYITEGSDFVRLTDPYKIRVHESVLGKDTYYVEEKMSLTPWVFQTTDKVYSVHREQIVTLGFPNKNLTEYYNNVRMGLFPAMKKELEPIESKRSTDEKFADMMEKMNDDDYFEMIEYLRGKTTKH
tara:strand:- start:4 stop:471 length:468 start_codon:yes stop_codon:yes gene_type:complete